MAPLSSQGRRQVAPKNFAIPEKGAYPIHDRAHAANALGRVDQFGTPREKTRVKTQVFRRYPDLKPN